jgi:hypothetical protein
LVRAALGFGLGAVLMIAGTVGAAVAGDDDDDDTADTKFFKGILTGLGLKSNDDPGIDYHERSPLVVPPTRDLPPPETTGSTGVTKIPEWPKDADVARRDAGKKKQKRPTFYHPEDDDRQLSPAELAKRAKNPGAPSSMPRQTDAISPQLPPSELGFQGFKGLSWDSLWRDKEEAVQFTKEPPRASLTEPPAGLRTPSPNQPYGTKGGLEPSKEIGIDKAAHGTDR